MGFPSTFDMAKKATTTMVAESKKECVKIYDLPETELKLLMALLQITVSD